MSGSDPRRIPVTVAIPVRNEERNLSACLARLGRFDEVVVIDSSSTDSTLAIAREYGASVLNFDWNGKFPKKRNWFLMNHPPSQDWVMFLDADELVDDAFCDAVSAAVTNANVSAYWIHYTNHFLGRPLRHGLQQRKLALFRVGKALYERIEEDGWSNLDMEIHEHPVVEGTVGRIDIPVEHRDDNGLGRFLEKHVDYARWEAKRYATLATQGASAPHFTRRQRIKYRYMTRWWYPTFYFLFTYVVKLGFLDGRSGYHYAAYKAWYFRTIRLMILAQTPKARDTVAATSHQDKKPRAS